MKKHSIRALIIIAATVLALASCQGDGNKPAGTTDGSKTTTEAPAQSTGETTNGKDETTNGTGDNTKNDGTDTSAPVTTEAPKKTGASGLEAVKGTVPTYVDGNPNHINLKNGDAYGIIANCDASFKAFNLYTATYDADTNDRITVKIYAYDTDYAKSVSGTALVDTTITGMPNGGWYMLTFESPLPAGEYVIVITGTSDGDDYGVAIWSQYGSPFFRTYKNGEELEDTGIWAQVIAE